jgi:predicted dehydrogenase
MHVMNRRTFIAGAVTAAYGSPNDRLRVANIGCGRRGLLKELLQLKDEANLDVAAVCDTWRQKREKAAADVKEATGKEPAQIVHYAEVLARKDIDVVVIGTPDFQHCAMLIDAVQAGKDVYVEKPLAMNMKELIRAVDAVKKSGRVVQIGTQMRSHPQSAGARKLLTSGELGKVLKVEQVRNSYMPYWMRFGGQAFFDSPPAEADVDWKAFLMQHRNRVFDPKVYQGWYGYREFSRGPHTNLMVHFIDLTHFVTGATIPQRVVALGGIYRWKDQFDAPDSIEVALEYPEGFLVRYCTVFGNSAGNYAKFFGTRGTLDAKNLSPREHWTITGDGSGEADRIREEMQVPESEPIHHMKNFIDCVRSRKEPIAPIEAGYAHSVAVIMADEALISGKRMVYDATKREIRAG